MLAVSDRIIWMTDGQVSKISDRSELQIKEGTIQGPGWDEGKTMR
jgi:hypothetical protein